MRDHTPIIFEEYNGFWSRGDKDSVPPDHFTDANNLDFSQSSIKSRKNFSLYAASGQTAVREMLFNTVVATVPTTFRLFLSASGLFYTQQIAPTIVAPVFRVTFANLPNDFDYVNLFGRAYITFSVGLVGLAANPIYVFDGSTFRQAGSPLPGTGMTVANSAAAGNVDAGLHAVTVAFETDSGFISALNLTSLTTFAAVVTPGNKSLDFANIPVAPGGNGVIARRLISTRTIANPPNADLTTLPLYFIPGGRIPNNVATTFTVNFFDSQLLADAGYLRNIFSVPPCGVGIGKYHNRTMIWGVPTQSWPGIAPNLSITTSPSTIYVSGVNNFETFDEINNVVVVDPATDSTVVDALGNTIDVGLTDGEEYRDVFYACKLNRTHAVIDNGNIPATWSVTVIDQGTGAYVQGITHILDTGGVNIEYLVIGGPTGIYLFNGLFQRPELSWKIADFWQRINYKVDSGNFYTGKYHSVMDTFNKKIYILVGIDGSSTPNRILLADYGNCFTDVTKAADTIRWCPWTFNDVLPRTLSVYDNGTLVRLLVADSVSNNVYEYNGPSATREHVSNPGFSTYLFADNEAQVIHIAGVRLRINGFDNITTSTVQVSYLNEDGTRSKSLLPFNILKTIGREPTVIGGFNAQKAQVVLSVNTDGFFDLNRMVVWVKPLWSSLPSISSAGV